MIKTKRQQACRTGEFLVAEIDAKVGGFGIVPELLDDGIVSSHYFLYEINESKLDRNFLGFFIQTRTFRDQVEAQGSTNYAAIRPTDVLGYQIPLPPLVEQKRVVALIEELFAKVNEARSLREQTIEDAEALLRSHCHEVFSALDLRCPPREFGSFHPHVTSGPRDWGKHYDTDGYRFYRAQDIGPIGKILENSKAFIIPPPGGQGRSAMPQGGDLLLVITGATVGRVSVFGEEQEPGFVSQHVAICRLPSGEVNPQFALWGLRAPNGQTQLLGQQYGQGKPGLNLSNIRSLRLPFPPLHEQQKIVEALDALQSQVDGLKRLYSESSAELGAMLPAILARAFEGEL